MLTPGNKDTIKDRIDYIIPGDPEEALDYLIEKGYVSKDYHWILEISKDRLLHIQHLEFKLSESKRNIRELLDTVNRFAKRLDALWWVWCDGGCESGVARYSDAELTEEIVQIAERNTKRLRRKWENLKYAREHYRK